MDITYILIALNAISILLLFYIINKSQKSETNYQPQLDQIHQSLQRFETLIREEFRNNREETAKLTTDNRNELSNSLKTALNEFRGTFEKSVNDFNQLQKDKFANLEERQNKLVESTEKRLDQMRETVDEKLSKTLAERLGQSFETVGNQLKAVQEGLGEMKTLAQDVGGLKKVLSNVKTRGGVGEIQLEMLLEQILAPDQYQERIARNRRIRH